MPGPMDPYLADIFAAFQPGADLAGYGQPSSAPVASGAPLPPVAPAPVNSGYPSLLDLASAPVPTPTPPPPAAPIGPPAPPAPNASSAFEDPNSLTSHAPPAVSQGPAPIPVGAEPPPPPAPPSPIGPDPHAFDLQATQGGGSPAHEVETRGPSVLGAQGQRNAVTEGAIGTIADRNQEAADREYQLAISQERTARVREEAYQQSVAEQEDELAARQADFDATSRQLSKMGQLNPDRLWASKSTAQKIAGGIEIMLAGFRGAPSAVQKRIDDDVKTQEFAYHAARSAADLKQTAFSTAMARYQNVNAARAMAKAAGIDVLQAQLAQVAAKNKGNETGNRAIAAMADLENERMMQIQQGIRFMPAQAGGRYWTDAHGFVYNEKEAHEHTAKQQEYAQQDRQEGARVGGQILVQRDKAALDNAGGNGDGMTKEQRGKLASEHGEADRSTAEFNDQIDFLKTLPVLKKSGISTEPLSRLGGRLAPESAKEAQEIEQINMELRSAVGKMAKDADGKPTRWVQEEIRRAYSLHPGEPESIKLQKIEGVRDYVNALARQQGAANAPRPHGQVKDEELPSSFQGYGKKK